jgi:hypothetical protein
MDNGEIAPWLVLASRLTSLAATRLSLAGDDDGRSDPAGKPPVRRHRTEDVQE